MPLINLIALAVSIALVKTVLVARNLSPWHALVIGLYSGQLLSIRVDLPEPLALPLCLGGIMAFEKDKISLSALFFFYLILSD